jgi:phosphoribosyl-ATP pyrophosphohydrolase/phosphoribosyl-AMP cyclohydrolase
LKIENVAQLAGLNFDKAGGLIPVVAQHARTGEVLMVAFADREALERTLRDGRMWYYSRTRGRYWRKGETSGNEQRLGELHTDCDRDSVLALVDPAGPTCHTGEWSCFGAPPTLPRLAQVIAQRATEPPEGSYTARLLADENLRLKKLGEEAVELALACAASQKETAAEEAADLIYHVIVASAAAGATLDGVLGVLERRRRLSAPSDE